MTRIPKVFLSEMFGELRVICEVKEVVYYVGRTSHTARKTLVTPKGQVYLAKKVAEGYKG